MSTKATAIHQRTPSTTYRPKQWLKCATIVVLCFSAFLITYPMLTAIPRNILLFNLPDGLSYNFAFFKQDLIITLRALFIVTGYLTFHLAIYFMAALRRFKRGLLTLFIGYAVMTLGVAIAWLIV